MRKPYQICLPILVWLAVTTSVCLMVPGPGYERARSQVVAQDDHGERGGERQAGRFALRVPKIKLSIGWRSTRNIPGSGRRRAMAETSQKSRY